MYFVKTNHFDWEEIFKDSADILSRSLAENRKPITKVSELYAALEKLYIQRDKKDMLPEPTTYNKKMHEKLELKKSQRIMKSSLYKLIGQYHTMSIQALSQYLTVKEEVSSQQICYLFLRLTKGERTITDNKKLLYTTCKQLKQRFAEEILFLSYDDDTIVLMFPDEKSRQKVKKFIVKNVPKQEDGEYSAE